MNPEGGLNHLESGVYTVTKVYCMQYDCLDIKTCHDGSGNCDEGVCAEIGLLDKDEGCYMICHEYRTLKSPPSDKKVYWRRKVPK